VYICAGELIRFYNKHRIHFGCRSCTHYSTDWCFPQLCVVMTDKAICLWWNFEL